PMKTADKQNDSWQDRKAQSAAWFRALRDRICAEFEKIEDELAGGPHATLQAGRFERKKWDRAQAQGDLEGGGEMAIMRGRVFEKVGVNVSEVWGKFSEEFRKQVPGAEESGGAF